MDGLTGIYMLMILLVFLGLATIFLVVDCKENRLCKKIQVTPQLCFDTCTEKTYVCGPTHIAGMFGAVDSSANCGISILWAPGTSEAAAGAAIFSYGNMSGNVTILDLDGGPVWSNKGNLMKNVPLVSSGCPSYPTQTSEWPQKTKDGNLGMSSKLAFVFDNGCKVVSGVSSDISWKVGFCYG